MSCRSLTAHRQAALGLPNRRCQNIIASTLFKINKKIGLEHTFKCRMKQEASCSDQEAADEGNEENIIMAMFQAVSASSVCQPHEQQVGQAVHNLGQISRCIIVLQVTSDPISNTSATAMDRPWHSHLFTKVQGRGYRIPIASLWSLVWYGWQSKGHPDRSIEILAGCRSQCVRSHCWL